MKTLISTDTSCLIDYETLKKYEISVFPLNVIIDGKEYLDGLTINQDDLEIAMISKKSVSTSTPPYGVIVDYFEKLFEKGYEHIIHFTISSNLSSMYKLFCNISQQYFDGKITIVDTKSLSSLMLSHVFYAYDEVQKGTELNEIIEKINQRITSNVVVFIPDNLTALKNGGRVSPAIAAIGNTIGIKPVIGLVDGALEKEGMARSLRNILTRKIKSIVEEYPIIEYDYCLVDFDGKESRIEHLQKQADNILGEGVLIRGIVPINVCAHCGPGTIGLLVSPKINGKSIKDFM